MHRRIAGWGLGEVEEEGIGIIGCVVCHERKDTTAELRIYVECAVNEPKLRATRLVAS